MRILYITPFLQHPALHGPTRHYYFIRELAKRHSISLLTPTGPRVTTEALDEMATYTEQMMTFDTTTKSGPKTENRLGPLAKLRAKIKRAQRNKQAVEEIKVTLQQLTRQGAYDVIVFHGKFMFSAIEEHSSLPIVADFCDATSMRIKGTMKYANKAKWPWLLLRYLQARRFEKKLVQKTAHLAFITGRDRKVILGPGSEAQVLPNMVDIDYWTRQTYNPQPHCIMYSGGMNYQPNVDGALYLINKILPLVRRSIADLEVIIVGRDPVPELIDAAKAYPDVTLTGSVADMRPYFERATVFAAPLRFAAGQQNKLIEAMAMETPVVTTPIAAAGMHMGRDEAPLMVAKGEQEFAACIVRLLGNEEERIGLAADGRLFIEKYFGGCRSAEILEKMCIDAVVQSRALAGQQPLGELAIGEGH